jgi:CRP-like cAMP-binding protein/cytochrome P450
MAENFSSIRGCPFHGGMAPKMPGQPILGNLMDLRNRPLDILIDGAAQHGSVFRLQALGRNVHVVSGQTAIDLIKENDETRIHRERLFDAFARETDVDIFGVMGERHKLLRSLIRLGYSRQVVAPFVPEMVRRLTESVRAWPKDIKVLDRVCHATAEAVGTALTPEPLSIPLQVFADFGVRVMMVIVRQWPKQLFHTPIHKKQKRQVQEALGSAIAAHRQGKYGDHLHTHIIDAFLHTEVDGNKMTERDIRGMGMYAVSGTYIYGGRAATFMIYELLKNPKLLSVVLEEVDAAFDEDGLNADLLRRMTYLRATFLESVRRYPLLPGLPYRAAQDLVIDGYEIPKEDILLLTGMPQHFLDPSYDNPWAFDANRCMAPRNEHRNQTAYSPWGFRPRVCAAIGLNEIVIMVTVATILRNLKLELLRPSYEFDLVMRPLICPKDGFPARVVGLRNESDYTAKRSFLMSRQVEEDQLIEPMYDFDLPHLEPEEVPAGTTVFKQGDSAESFYIIVKGAADVVKTVNGETNVVAQLIEGDSFGEVGLLKSVPRTATVLATEDLKLLRLNRVEFLQIISDSDLVANELGYIIQRRFVEQTLLQTMPSLRLEKLANIASEFEIIHIQPGEVVFEEGEAANAMFIIVSGEFDIVKKTADGERVIKTSSVGEIFGEIGILQHQPRMATVRNSKENSGVLAKITREKTETLLAESGQAHGELALLASKRLMEAVEIMSGE